MRIDQLTAAYGGHRRLRAGRSSLASLHLGRTDSTPRHGHDRAGDLFCASPRFFSTSCCNRLISTQREQIAALKAFGYTQREIGWHYLKLALLIVARRHRHGHRLWAPGSVAGWRRCIRASFAFRPSTFYPRPRGAGARRGDQCCGWISCCLRRRPARDEATAGRSDATGSAGHLSRHHHRTARPAKDSSRNLHG